MVPKHWEILRTDSVTVYIRNQINPDEIKSEFVFHYSIPAVQETGTGQYDLTEEVGSAKQLITKKSVLISKLNPRKATICIAEPKDEITICSSEFIAMEAKKCDLKYLFYLMNSEMNRQRLDAKVQSVTRSHQRVYPSDIYRFWTALPSTTEQQAIASFLDRETARIDALIQKKERMIELLKEKRIALITQAVTKGLDPNVPMKDSGIEWLGEVPEHWTVLKFKNIGSFQGGAGFPDDEQGLEDEEIPFYKVSDMNLPGNETYMCQHNNSVSRETALKLRASILRKNTIVFAKVGAALLLNRRRIITKDSCIDNNMMGFSTTHCDVMWCYFFLFQLDLGKLVNPGAVPSVNESQMSNIPVCVPPTQEQKQIGDYLVTETTKINKMIDKVNASIIQLSEYRASLIHHAVTGKIDLRGHDAHAQ